MAEVYYSEWEREPTEEESHEQAVEHRGCPTYPATATTEHPASSYGLPVLVLADGHAYGPLELPHGEVQIVGDSPEADGFAGELARAGYRVCGTRLHPEYWGAAWESATRLTSYGALDARWLEF